MDLLNFESDLQFAEKSVYNKSGFELTNQVWNPESTNYGACTFQLNNYKIQHRFAHITPTKSGQFVAIWKRNKNGSTVSYTISDDFDFIIISVRDSKNFGQFIFPKSVLACKGIIYENGRVGKRGIRFYAPWDSATSKQALKTKSWQVDYFLGIRHFIY